MTTDLHVLRAPNIFVDNEVLCLDGNARTVGVRLAGAAWLATGVRPREAHRRSLSHAVELLDTRLSGCYEFWLLACHTAWQADTRIVRYRKLWNSLKASGFATPIGRNAGEALIEGPSGLRYFGAVQLGPGSLEQAIAILEEEPASHLVALKMHDDAIAQDLMRGGWSRADFGPSVDVLAAVCSRDGIVFWPVGAFDDWESGCVALAKPDIIDQLLL